MSGRPPVDLVIIGAPKAGTTTLARWLELHPDAFLPAEKEVAYFDLNYHKGRAWYDEKYAPGGDAMRVDATPAYMYVDVALERLAADAPNAKLVVILREPMDRVWSHYWYNRSMGIDPRSFRRILKAEARDKTNAPRGLPIGYIEVSRYTLRLERFMEHFDRSQLLVLFFDDLRTDPKGVWQRLCHHAGLAETELPADGKAFNVGQMPRSAWVQHILLRSKPGKWPLNLGKRISKLNTRKGSYPKLPEHLRTQLEEMLHGETMNLDAWLPGEVPESWPRV